MLIDPMAIVGLVTGIASLITSVGLGVRWLVRHYFDEIKAELKPNSGSSLKDQVNRLEKDVQSNTEKIDHMYDVLLDYIAKSNRASRTKNSKN